MKYLLFIFLFALSCQNASSQVVQNLNTDDFIKTYKQTAKAVLLDVRTPGEWQKGKISNATCIDFMNESFQSQAAKLDKNNPIFVYCAGGVRSAKASKQLEALGFKKVYNLSNAGHGQLVGKGLK